MQKKKNGPPCYVLWEMCEHYWIRGNEDRWVCALLNLFCSLSAFLFAKVKTTLCSQAKDQWLVKDTTSKEVHFF